MKKYLFSILALVGLLASCGDANCDCTPGHDDYQGYCPCYGDNCQCPVRLQRSFNGGEIVFDIWNRDPLTTADTLFIKATSTLWKPNYVLYGTYNVPFDSLAPDTYMVKLVMPAGDFLLVAGMEDRHSGTRSTVRLAKNVHVIN